MMEGRHAMPHVLLVEDSESDAELTRLGFERAQMDVTLDRAKDGEEGIAFLRKEGRYASAPTPDLVLLDLNMPRMNGREVLAEIAKDERLPSAGRGPHHLLSRSRGVEHVPASLQLLRGQAAVVRGVREGDGVDRGVLVQDGDASDTAAGMNMFR
jgi:CheY-like chemotaxis protein